MKNLYRLTVRFDLDDEDERRTADYLRNLDKDKYGPLNGFVIKAVESYIHGLENFGGNNFTLEDVRRVIREETQNLCVTAPVAPIPVRTSADEQSSNDANVLEALEMF